MLFGRECKKILVSLVFVIYFAVVAAVWIFQYGSAMDNRVEPPEPGREDYGSIEKEIPELAMNNAAASLLMEYQRGCYVAYPYGLYKEVRLKEKDRARMQEILMELTGMDTEMLDSYVLTERKADSYVTDENGNSYVEYPAQSLSEDLVSEGLTYERFREYMEEVDALIGGGSKYGEKYFIKSFGQVPMTYEEAVAEYETFMEGNLGVAYTRLYCDYMGIFLAILPVFLCASFCMMDKNKVNQLLYGRRISSLRFTVMRYGALLCCGLLPVALTYLCSIVKINALYPEKHMQWFPAVWLLVCWLVPQVMAVLALSLFLAEAVSPLLSLVVHAVWWFVSLTANELTGSISKWTLVIRHNKLQKADVFYRQYETFCWNRGFYFVLAVAFVLLTVLVYERKRRGCWFGK